MADFTLTLGDVSFQDFEIPDEIKNLGGEQTLQTHKYAGGQKTIDAFGADDAPIGWSGTFLDGNAEQRCQALDAMRRAGTPALLSFSSFSYDVVIKKFTFDFQRFYQIPYSIELEVQSDNTQPITDNGDDSESVIQGDFNDATQYAAGFV